MHLVIYWYLTLHITLTLSCACTPQATRPQPLPPKLAISSLNAPTVDDVYQTTTSTAHDYKPSETILQQPVHKKAPGSWKVNYTLDAIDKVGWSFMHGKRIYSQGSVILFHLFNCNMLHGVLIIVQGLATDSICTYGELLKLPLLSTPHLWNELQFDFHHLLREHIINFVTALSSYNYFTNYLLCRVLALSVYVLLASFPGCHMWPGNEACVLCIWSGYSVTIVIPFYTHPIITACTTHVHPHVAEREALASATDNGVPV